MSIIFTFNNLPNKYYKYMPFLKNLSVLQKQKLKFWIREISNKINANTV